jgi:hypothetical protein
MKREHKEEKKSDLMNCPLMENNRDNTTNTDNIAITKSGKDKIMIAKKRNWQQHKKRRLQFFIPLGKSDRGSIDHSHSGIKEYSSMSFL